MISLLNHIKKENLASFEKRYYREMIIPSGGKNTKNRYDSLKKLSFKSYSPDEISFVNVLRRFYKKVILGRPIVLQRFVEYSEAIGFAGFSKNYKKDLKLAFGYKPLRNGYIGQNLAKFLDIKACPYCNAQYTLQTKSGLKILHDFDHYFPHEKYPFLSVSLFNLIPSCRNCNGAKNDKESRLDSSFNPYSNESVSDNFNFKLSDIFIIKRYLTGDRNVDIETKINPNASKKLRDKVEKHLLDYSILDLFKRHSDHAEELLWKYYIYDKNKRETLLNFEKNGKRIFSSKEDLERFIVGNYTSSKDQLKRPLAKFQTDIAKQLKLI